MLLLCLDDLVSAMSNHGKWQDSMDYFKKGLRSQDVNSGLRNLDPNSGPVVQYLEDTRLIGMSASLALIIKGQDVVEDAQALKAIAADQLDIDPFAFRDVVKLLEDTGAIYNIKLDGETIKSFSEKIPLHKDLFEYLGRQWEARKPTEIESAMLYTVDVLATGPFRASEYKKTLGIDRKARKIILELGKQSELIKELDLTDGDQVYYSPYFSFENPKIMVELFAKHTNEVIRAEFEKLKNYQGIPLDFSLPVLNDAVARGLIQAPSIEDPDGIDRSFAFAPYTLGQEYLTTKKAILEKALAILACVRCGQHFGGITSINAPERILEAFLDPLRDRRLNPHSSHRRQYRLVHRMGIVRFIPSGSWVQPQLIETQDNIEAVKLAIELLKYSGEPLSDRGIPSEAPKMLMNQGRYLNPIMTVHRKRNRLALTDSQWEDLVNAATGRKRIE